MKSSGRKRNFKRIIIFALCCITGTVSILCLTAYQVVHSYIGKVNYVPLDKEGTITENQLSIEDAATENPGMYEEALASEALGEQYEGNQSEEAVMASATISNSDTVSSGEQNTSVNSPDTAEEDIEALDQEIAQNIENDSIPVTKDSKVLNILMIGTDNRSTSEQGLSDSMILLSVNKEAKSIVTTSLLRDIYLSIPGYKNNRLNVAYAIGGANLLIQTIENNFKINIDKYAAVDFYSFIGIVDAIGGIELEITEEELPYVNACINDLNGLLKEEDSDLLTKAGLQKLNGKQVLSYARVRNVGTDFGRTSRQRTVLEVVYNKVKTMNMTQLNDLLDLLLPQITTNFSEKEIFRQLLSLPDYVKYNIDSLSIPIKGTYQDMTIRGMQVLGINFNDNIKELQNRIYHTRP